MNRENAQNLGFGLIILSCSAICGTLPILVYNPNPSYEAAPPPGLRRTARQDVCGVLIKHIYRFFRQPKQLEQADLIPGSCSASVVDLPACLVLLCLPAGDMSGQQGGKQYHQGRQRRGPNVVFFDLETTGFDRPIRPVQVL